MTIRRLEPTLLAMAPLLLACALGCDPDGPGTSVRVALAYDDTLGLDTAEVTVGTRTQSAAIAHELLLLVPDELAGVEMPIEVWGRKAAQRAAYGTASAVPVLGKTVEAQLSLTACTPGCQGNMLLTCTGPAVTCALGCGDGGGAHCLARNPSNGIDPTLADPLSGTIVIAADTTFDTATGAITGGLVRPPGSGVASGIAYTPAPASGSGGALLGIFAFHNLTVEAGVEIRITGTRAAVFLVGDAARIGGFIDLSANRGDRSNPGPGGGVGGSNAGPATGCGAGTGGASNVPNDGGGGGGGGSEPGGAGGAPTPVIPAAGGPACLPALLEPIQGGGGGGSGSRGSALTGAGGGGGGGALQITAFGSLEVTGTIHAGGRGGDGGPLMSPNPGAGGGGGAGGAVLLEAPMLTIGPTAILAANGGGGGGGGGGVPAQAGLPGDDASASDQPAQGGAGSENAANGGSGGHASTPTDVGGNGASNGGGGGGAVGRIVLRGTMRSVAGMISPPPTQAGLKPLR